MGKLDLVRHRLVVTEVEGVLEIMEVDRPVALAERRAEIGARHQPESPHWRLAQVDEGFQPLGDKTPRGARLFRRSRPEAPEILEDVASDIIFRHFSVR